jgi:membrane protein YqaA with SNARE-associated domain
MNYLDLSFQGLFLICFLSATLLSFPSELFLILMLSKGSDPLLCLCVSTIGNSLGGITNYGIGRIGNPNGLKKLGMNSKKFTNRKENIQKFGSWLALLSWVPFIGEPLLIGLGFFRVSIVKVFLLMTLGKFIRYLIIVLFCL